MADRDSPIERRILLAHEPPFHLGGVMVCPPTRELIGETKRAILEPRVMQVLIALAQAADEIVTRDDLIMRCWHGTIVGENAIHRVISRLRLLAETLDGVFEIDTINKVGYRLRIIEAKAGSRQISASAPSEGPTPREPNGPRWSRRGAVGAILGGGAALAALGGLALGGRSTNAGDRVASDLLAQAEQASRADLPEEEARAAALLARATALAPRRPDAWGKLALARAGLAQYGDPAQAATLVEATEEAARRALALDPHQADALCSLAILPPFYGDWLAAERRMDAVLRSDPNHVPTHDARSFLYVAAGRARAGARERLAYVANDPLHAGYQFRMVYAYWILDRIGDADRTADRALQLWPQHPGVWFSRLWTLAFTGRAERALLHVDDQDRRPDLPAPVVETLRSSMIALAGRRPADIGRAIDLVMADVAANPSGSVNALMILCGLGAIDRAFAVAQAYYLERGSLIANGSWRPRDVTVKDQHRRKTNMLFTPVAGPMQSDPRFAQLMEDMGLSQYWLDAGVEPDFMRARFH